jgi:hypothetical protein
VVALGSLTRREAGYTVWPNSPLGFVLCAGRPGKGVSEEGGRK